jgi:hypothetical protein
MVLRDFRCAMASVELDIFKPFNTPAVERVLESIDAKIPHLLALVSFSYLELAVTTNWHMAEFREWVGFISCVTQGDNACRQNVANICVNILLSRV